MYKRMQWNVCSRNVSNFSRSYWANYKDLLADTRKNIAEARNKTKTWKEFGIKMTRSEAETLRGDIKNWRWGIIYNCPKDPRVIVRNRFVFGWTWNFGHSSVFIWIGLAVIFALGIPYVFAVYGSATVAGLSVVLFTCLLIVITVANYISSGPR